MKTVEFRFKLRLPELLAEGVAELVLKRLKSILPLALCDIPHIGENVAHDHCAIIKPDDMSREFGAQDKWLPEK